MVFYDDPRREQIELMHEFMCIWADYWRDRPACGVSITWVAMNSIRLWSKRKKEIEEAIVTGKPIRLTRTDTAIIAEKVRKLIHDQEAWKGHKRERDILTAYYLKVKPSFPQGKIAAILDCKPWQIDRLVKDSLYFMSQIWKD